MAAVGTPPGTPHGGVYGLRMARRTGMAALGGTRVGEDRVELDWTALLVSLGLLGAAAVLVVLEVFVVSFGLLLIAAIACAVGSIWYAFAAHEAAGWVSVTLIPVGALFAARWGLVRIRASRSAVPKSEVVEDAGYRHVAERLAIGPGSPGCSSPRPVRSAGPASRGASATCRYTVPFSRGGPR